MKTHIIALIFSLVSVGYSLSQITIKFSGDTTLKESYDANNKGTTIKKITLNVSRKGNVLPTFNIPVQITEQHVTTSNADFRIINPNILITQTDFVTKGANFKIDVYIEINKDNEKADLGDEVFKLKINADLAAAIGAFVGTSTIGSDINITILDAPISEHTFDPFRITVGANFDFEKTVSASLYFDAQAYRPNLFYCKKQKSGFGLGFYGSLYHNKYISQDSVQAYEQQFQEPIGTGDSIDLVRYNYQIGISNSFRNVGAEGALIWGWENNINNDVYVSNTLVFPEFSAIHRRVLSTYSYDRINVDTLFNVPTPDTIRRLIERNFTNSTHDEVLVGVGYIGRFHSKKHGELMLKFTTGAAFQKSSIARVVRTYYAFRFQLLDPKVGINLGGEIRGYYGSPSPYFGVYLSKSFSLKKLTEY